jgi:hypothetical protein
MKKSDSEIAAPQCNPPGSVACENAAEILLRYASLATAGLPTADIEHVISILLRPKGDATQGDEESAVSRPASNAG